MFVCVHQEMKESVKKEHTRTLRIILKSGLNAKKKITGICRIRHSSIKA